MGRRFGREPGGILALLDLHDAHPHALERELIALGARWRDVGSEGFTWGDAWAVANAPAPGSALYVALSPESRGWSADTYVMADLYDAIQQNTHVLVRANGGKPKQPPRYPRPGAKATDTSTEVKHHRSPLRTRDELAAIFGWDQQELAVDVPEPTKPRPCCLMPAPCKHRS